MLGFNKGKIGETQFADANEKLKVTKRFGKPIEAEKDINNNQDELRKESGELEKVDSKDNDEWIEENKDVKKPVVCEVKSDSGETISSGNNTLKPNQIFSKFGIEYKTDDKGKVYCIDGKLLPNQSYMLDGHEYKTDDKGKVYCIDGKLLPNQSYMLDGHEYETDDKGNIYRKNGENLPNANFVLDGKYYETDEKCEIKETISNYQERLQHTPCDGERGKWDDQRGESKYIPSDEEIKGILSNYDMDGVEYKNCIPDFKKCSIAEFEIDNMTERREGKGGNFEQCDQKLAEQFNKESKDGKTDWTLDEIRDWRRKNGFSWHECNDRKTCQLVPTKINDYFGHLGGVSECKKANALMGICEEDKFDE